MTLVASITVLALAHTARAQAPLLPDLVSDPPERPQLQVYAQSGQPTRLLLRFDGFVHNDGPAPLELHGTANVDGLMTQVFQKLGDGSESLLGSTMPYETSDDHDHFHLKRAAAFTLTAPGGGPAAPDEKVGFCLMDSERRSGSTPSKFRGADFCQAGRRDATDVVMGVSPGWRDEYVRTLQFQWIDVSETQPGEYHLRSQIDPDDMIVEAEELNAPSAPVTVRIPGYLARGRIAARESASDGVGVSLATTAVTPATGELDPPEYKILTPPAHGTLSVPVGAWTSDPTVLYTPDPSAPQADDTFTYAVREQGSGFPRTPSSATVALGVGTPERVAIGGAPERLLTGTTAQLSATVSDALSGDPVTWSVNGVEGGTAQAGRISASGLFTAPKVVPPSGVVTVRASASGAYSQATIAVAAPPAPEPAPVPEGAQSGDSAEKGPRPLAPTPPAGLPPVTIRDAWAQRTRRFVAVSVVAGRSGRLRVALRRSGRTVAACSLRVRAGRSYVCRLRRPRRGTGKLSVTVVLTRLDGRKVTRQVRVLPTSRLPHRH